MVNGALSGEPSDRDGIERARCRCRPTAIAGPAEQITTTAQETPSVRGSLLACATISLTALWTAAFVMPFADVPEATLLPFFLLTALAFVACGRCFSWGAFAGTARGSLFLLSSAG
jgi:hypothetical protein